MTTINTARAQFYRLLSSLFAKEVDSALTAELLSEKGQGFLQHLASEAAFAQAIEQINAQLNALKTEQDILVLSADFCGLFLVGGKHSASPYAGHYMEPEQSVLFGRYHQKMQQVLSSNELALHANFPEPADHIAVILAYTAHLCTQADTQEQLSFINDFLSSWINDFSAQVSSHDAGGFYRAVAALSAAWVRYDLECLSEAS